MNGAARDLVAAFAGHERQRYFDSFAPTATFIFYNSDRIFHNRAEYESEWQVWEATGFKVLGCQSIDGSVMVLSEDVAIFTHQVRTKLNTEHGVIETGERETIVFQLLNGTWLGVHEHLSIDPTFIVGK